MWKKLLSSVKCRYAVAGVAVVVTLLGLTIPGVLASPANDVSVSPVSVWTATPMLLSMGESKGADSEPVARSMSTPSELVTPEARQPVETTEATVRVEPTATPWPATPTPEPTATPGERELAANRGGREAPESTVEQSKPAPAVGKRVGLQVGHWQCANLPAEFASLRRSTGGSGGGYQEVDVNLKVARLVATILEQNGVYVDLLPATVPVKYQADAFVAIHCDANSSSGPRGFKAARSGRSAIPNVDDALVKAIYDDYIAATGFPRSSAITNNMLYYYSFNSNRSNSHTVASTTPAAIVELGYLTNPIDRAVIVNSTEIVADGLARGILSFLNSQ